MTKSTITRARMQEMLEWCEVFRRHPRLDDIAEAIRMALAAMDSEPVFTLEVSQADYKGQKLGNHFGFITLDAARNLKEGSYQLYRHAQPAPVVPDGYVMVPKEPTEEMLQASYREAAVYSPTAYRAMIAAAPQEGKQ